MKRLSILASKRVPFLFYTNFDATKAEVYTLNQLQESDIEFSMQSKEYKKHTHKLNIFVQEFNSYKRGFDAIIEKIKAGETYLLNYTCETPIQTDLTLKEIFSIANAPFKLRVKNEFVCFSPERFIRIKGNRIFTYPMKGTIDASIPNAKEKILNNKKESAEHIMIVDLLRNDLSMVSKEVKVNLFRYISKIKAGEKELLQVSSEIEGNIGTNWRENLTKIIQRLLPAGSISGTPKKRTVEIIKDIESYERGYFSGIFGYFDGKELDCAVMIRFIEQTSNGLVYKSGGGITIESQDTQEYQEMQDKIYLP